MCDVTSQSDLSDLVDLFSISQELEMVQPSHVASLSHPACRRLKSML
jgi:hypothetical protein